MTLPKVRSLVVLSVKFFTLGVPAPAELAEAILLIVLPAFVRAISLSLLPTILNWWLLPVTKPLNVKLLEPPIDESPSKVTAPVIVAAKLELMIAP